MLRDLVSRAAALEPFEHGDFLGQLGHELLTLRVELGDELAAERRGRRNRKVPFSVRQRVFRRDDFTCGSCGYRASDDEDERVKQYRSGLYLTIDHVIPLAEGGANHWTNMQTLCEGRTARSARTGWLAGTGWPAAFRV